jgi:hypothetical protein
MFKLWEEHGTKILGALVTLHAAIGFASEEIRQLLPDTGDVWFELLYKLAAGLLGVGVMKRGFTNGAKPGA